MVTGDNMAIAKHIADILGIGRRICPAREILKLKENEIGEPIDKCDGYSEVFPEHKYRIVEYLQRKGHLVAMTGDGVNDAPALKKANCGIAVSSSTDAARAAADVFLLEPGLSVIADAIKEARRIFQRMESYVVYRIAETIRVLFFIVLSILVFNFYPITAVMIVLLALLNDAPILAIAYDNVKEMKEPSKMEPEGGYAFIRTARICWSCQLISHILYWRCVSVFTKTRVAVIHFFEACCCRSFDHFCNEDKR
jgi:H+-transporting ATPase